MISKDSRDSIDQVFEKLQEDDENCKCADCGTVSPVFASIKFGTFLCAMCASQHESSKIRSKIKSILSNNWSLAELNRMNAGGNRAFKEYTDYYEITDFDLELKYRTRALALYKKILSELLSNNEFSQDLPSIEEGKFIVINENNEWILKIKETAESLGTQALQSLESISEKTSEKLSELNFEEIKGKTSFFFNQVKSQLEQSSSVRAASKIKESTWSFFQSIEESIELSISKAKNIVSST